LILVSDLISSIIYRDTRANLYQLELIVSWESRREGYGGGGGPCQNFLGRGAKGAVKEPRRALGGGRGGFVTSTAVTRRVVAILCVRFAVVSSEQLKYFYRMTLSSEMQFRRMTCIWWRRAGLLLRHIGDDLALGCVPLKCLCWSRMVNDDWNFVRAALVSR
jgi:hypothetical protein